MRQPRDPAGAAEPLRGRSSPPDQPMHRHLGYLLRAVYARFTAAQLRAGPLSRDLAVLDVLADQDAPSQGELAERLGVNRTIMVRLVDRLEDAGYLTRTRNPANRRSYVLSITDAGRAALAEMRRTVSDRDARLTAALSAAQRRRLNELLARLLTGDEQPAPTSTEHLVAQAHFRMRRRGDALVADLGLRMRHFSPLAALDRIGPCPQQRLARYLGITEPAAAEVVDELVRAGLVARGHDPDDRRRYALELTALGRRRLGRLTEAVDRLRAETGAALGPGGEAELRELLVRLLP